MTGTLPPEGRRPARPRPVAPAPPPKAAAEKRSHRINQVLAAALCVFLGILVFFFLAVSACFNEEYRGGSWSDLGAAVALMTVIPALGVICCTLALSLRMRRATRVHHAFATGALTVAFLLGCPFTSFFISRGVSLQAALLLSPSVRRSHRPTGPPPPPPAWMGYGRLDSQPAPNPQPASMPRPLPPEAPPLRDPAVIARHYETLTRQFARPQKVARAERGLLVLADGKVLSLYGVHISLQDSVDLSSYARSVLAVREVMIRLPDRQTFAGMYTPRPNAGFGTIPAYVYLGSALVNARYRTTPGSYNDFGEYEKPPVPGR